MKEIRPVERKDVGDADGRAGCDSVGDTKNVVAELERVKLTLQVGRERKQR